MSDGPTIEETNSGTYKEPFTHVQVGCFTTTKDGKTKFLSAGVSERDAFIKIENTYREWNSLPTNNMDMTELDRVFYRQRPVTYGLWDESYEKELEPW